MTNTLTGRDLLTLGDLAPEELALILDTAASQKAAWAAGDRSQPLSGLSASLIFQKPSLRTRVSFEVACARLGLHPVTLAGAESALSRGESIHDTAKVLDRYVDVIVMRTFDQSLLEELAEHAEVPVVNALTDDYHPCQGLADLLTIQEHIGELVGVRVAYVGDGNNMAHTYLLGGALAGMHVAIATPEGFAPAQPIVERALEIAAETGATITLTGDPQHAANESQVVITDTWASMGQEDERAERLRAFDGFSVDEELMACAADGALFMHCLPAHRGEEVCDEVIDAPCSVVFDEAENRLHAQKALLSLILEA